MKQAILHFDKGDILLLECEQSEINKCLFSILPNRSTVQSIGRFTDLSEGDFLKILDKDCFSPFPSGKCRESFLSKMEAGGWYFLPPLMEMNDFTEEVQTRTFLAEKTFVFRILG